MNYILLDLEATCDNTDSSFPMEIIEIGAVKIPSDNLQQTTTYQSFVKPIQTKQLTDYCTNLTTIQQEDVESALRFPEVLAEFKTFCGSQVSDRICTCTPKPYLLTSIHEKIQCPTCSKHLLNQDYVLISWGYYDKKQLMKDCTFWQYDTEWLRPHMSLKHEYARIVSKRPCGIRKALNREGLSFEGTLHRALCDTQGFVPIFKKYYDKLIIEI